MAQHLEFLSLSFVTEVSRRMVTMFACEVEIVDHRFVCRPRQRAVHIPLSQCSAHSDTVHLWWPVGYALGLDRLCSLQSEYEIALRSLFDRVASYHTPEAFLWWLRARIGAAKRLNL